MTFQAFLWENRWFWLGPPLVLLGLLTALMILSNTYCQETRVGPTPTAPSPLSRW